MYIFAFAKEYFRGATKYESELIESKDTEYRMIVMFKIEIHTPTTYGHCQVTLACYIFSQLK